MGDRCGITLAFAGSISDWIVKMKRGIFLFIGALVVMGVVAFKGKLGAAFGLERRDAPAQAELRSQVEGLKETVAEIDAVREEDASLKTQVERDAESKREYEVLSEEFAKLDSEDYKADPEGYLAKLREMKRAIRAEKERIDRSFAETKGLNAEQLEELRAQMESRREETPKTKEMPEE